jgi:outer membrane immunogenic protein
MKSVLRSAVATSIVATVALFSSMSAYAADLPPAPAPLPRAPVAYVPVVQVYNWNGFYVGVNGGYGWANAKWTPIGGAANTVNPNGGVAGGTVGFNYQMNQFVFGVEGDWDWSGITGSSSTAICNATGECQTGNKWLSTLRGRAGFAMDRALFYLTAGGVFANVQTVTANTNTATHTQAGWAAGLGVEYAFAENWTAKFEYLYANIGSITVTCQPGTACAGLPIAVSLTENLLRAGINYKFNF